MKQLELGTEALGGRICDLKSSLGQLILKLETDPNLNWHSFLDSYALISGILGVLIVRTYIFLAAMHLYIS